MNLAPPSGLEFSRRVRHGGVKLYYPFVFVMGFDVWWNEAQKIKIPCGLDVQGVLDALNDRLILSITPKDEVGSVKDFRDCLTLELLQNFQFMSMFGRPALHPTFCLRKEYNSEKRRNATLELLMEKLLCKPIASLRKPDELGDKENMAVLGALAAIEVSAASMLATELSAGHMRPVAGVSEDRHMVYTLEISEPLMALAAHKLILKGKITWECILRSFRATQLNSSTMPGFVGEFCAQVLILMAWQVVLGQLLPGNPESGKQVVEETTIPFVPVIRFLEALLGSTFTYLLVTDEVGMNMKKKLANALLRAHQFGISFFLSFLPYIILSFLPIYLCFILS